MEALASPGLGQMRIPDILETIADLSNDEVFTPPELANKVLDMLPESIWSDSSITFLDPATKTGIFLREITKRLIAGLEKEIPDLQERVNHILTKQVYGLGITELTTLMSRRTLYCSTTANGPQSVCTEFESTEGNIRFPASQHSFDKKGKCSVCGAGKDLYYEEEGLDNYAYSFLHDNLKEVFGDVKFDVIIGNPPYQMNVGNTGGNSFSSMSIYHNFVNKAIELNPKYITMIIPSRWLSGVPKGIPREWVEKMIGSQKIKILHDFESSDMLFDGVGVAGGINYFLWDTEHNGECEYYHHFISGETVFEKRKLDAFDKQFVLRNPKYSPIIKKIEKIHKNYYRISNNNFSSFVSPKNFFDNRELLTTNWKDYKLKKDNINNIMYYVSKMNNNVDCGWINLKQIPKNVETLKLNKVYITAGYGGHAKDKKILSKPRYGPPNSVCSQTYLIIGYDHKRHNLTKEECLNIISYIETKFFRFLVKAKKTTQDGARGVYQFVPLQDWSKPWTDEELYKKYKLTEEEIAYIEENIDAME